MEIIIQGLFLGLSIAAPIGPTNVEIIRRGLKEGWKSSALFFLGVLVALTTYIFIVVLGLSVLMQSKLFNFILLFFGVIVLFYLSFNSIKDFFNSKEINLSSKPDGKNNFISGIILTISNPVVLLFWTGIMGVDLASNNSTLFRGLSMSLGILFGVISFTSILISMVHWGRRFVSQRNFKYVSLVAGLVLLYFAIKFGLKFISSFTSF